MCEYAEDPQPLTLKIGDQIITLIFRGRSEAIVPFYRTLYREFLVDDQPGERVLEIHLLPKTGNELFGIPKDQVQHSESAFSSERLADWVGKNGKWTDVSVAKGIIGIQSLNGLLLFSPDTACARIFIPEKDKHPYQSLYRLFWIYFAQVVGETGGCFLHAASMEKEGKGFVFIGGSGAGKSTLARLSNDANVLADEAPVISDCDKDLRVYPSPYHQLSPEHNFGKRLIDFGAPIEGLYFIVMDKKTFVEPVSGTDAIAMILARYIHFFFYVTPNARAKIFDLFHRTCHNLSIFCLHYAINTDVLKVLC